MEIKKSPKADLQNKRGLLLEIGLAVSLLLVIVAFAYTPKEHRIEKVDLNYGPVEEQITEITRQDQKPPEMPKKVEVKVISDLLSVVTNDTKITTDVDFADFDEDVDVVSCISVRQDFAIPGSRSPAAKSCPASLQLFSSQPLFGRAKCR